jgi:DHA1 family multidrug resistance protein-like MFS transporter
MRSWRRTFRAVWFSNLVAGMGMMSILPFFPVHLEALGVEERGSLALWTGLVYGAAPFSAAFASPLWGALGDRFGRRLMVLRSMAALFVFVGAMAFVTAPWQLLCLRIVQGVFSGFLAPSMTLVSTRAPREQQGRLAGSLQGALIWGAIAGPLLGEVVRDELSVEAVYLMVSALSAVSFLVVLLFADEDDSTRQGEESSGAARPRAGVRAALSGSLGDLAELRSSRDLRAAVVILFWIQFGIGSTNPQLELFVRDLPHSWWGRIAQPSAAMAFSVLAVANLLALKRWGSAGDRGGHRRALDRCALASAMGLFLHAVTPSYEVLLVARVLLGIAAAGAGPLAFGVAAAETAADRRGGAMGVVFSSRAFAVSLSAALGGLVSSWVGIPATFALGGTVVLLAAWGMRRGYPQSVGEVGGSDPNL